MDKTGSSETKASEAATRILRELGVNKTEKLKRFPSTSKILDDQIVKKNTPASSSTAPNEKGKPESLDAKIRHFLLKLGYTALFGLSCFTILLLAGGHLNVLDRSLFQQLKNFRLHQLEFTKDLQMRLVDNYLNLEPLVVLEGNLRNLFSTDDSVGQVQLKALAFDSDYRLLESRTTFAGTLLSEEELKQLSRSEILRLYGYSQGRDVPNQGLFRYQDLPFQTVFFTTGIHVVRTTVQIVSYRRNGEIVYVNTPDPYVNTPDPKS